MEEKVTRRYVRISQLPKDFPIKPGTLYIWRHTGRYPQLFSKIGGALFIDLQEWEKMVEERKGRNK
ncbi:hypothetical protein JCM13304A_04740 [Desulfothermus okinawensis JCM 13304]